MSSDDDFARALSETMKNSGLNSAVSECESNSGPVVNLCLSALERADRGIDEAKTALENVGSIEMASLEKNMT